jgi:hypothetical protein
MTEPIYVASAVGTLLPNDDPANYHKRRQRDVDEWKGKVVRIGYEHNINTSDEYQDFKTCGDVVFDACGNGVLIFDKTNYGAFMEANVESGKLVGVSTEEIPPNTPGNPTEKPIIVGLSLVDTPSILRENACIGKYKVKKNTVSKVQGKIYSEEKYSEKSNVVKIFKIKFENMSEQENKGDQPDVVVPERDNTSPSDMHPLARFASSIQSVEGVVTDAQIKGLSDISEFIKENDTKFKAEHERAVRLEEELKKQSEQLALINGVNNNMKNTRFAAATKDLEENHQKLANTCREEFLSANNIKGEDNLTRVLEIYNDKCRELKEKVEQRVLLPPVDPRLEEIMKMRLRGSAVPAPEKYTDCERFRSTSSANISHPYTDSNHQVIAKRYTGMGRHVPEDENADYAALYRQSTAK